MADITTQSLLDPNAAELQGLNRQQAYAQALMAQGMNQPQGQMVSGRYVAPSFAQYLNPLAQTLTGAYLGNKAEKEAANLALQLRQGRQQEQQGIMQKLNNNDTKGALELATNSQYGAGKELIPALVGSVIPKTPESVAEYNAAKADGFKGTYNEWKTQITPFQKEELRLKNIEVANAARNAAISPQENQLRTSFLNQAQPHIQISQAYRKIVSAPETAAGDMSRIFGYMKILDPGSTVREGEYASAENARGVPASVMAQYNKVLNGQRLTPQQRNEFTQSAGDLVNSQKQQFGDVAKYYGDISGRYGVNPQNIIYDPYQGLDLKTTPPKQPKTQGNVAQQFNIPQISVLNKADAIISGQNK